MHFCVFDVETTGFNPKKDRILEIGLVLMDEDGATIDEFESLVNPMRDIGNSEIHGVEAKVKRPGSMECLSFLNKYSGIG